MGDDFDIRTSDGFQPVEIIEKAILHPHQHQSQWDSRNSILEGESYGPITVVSMLDALAVHIAVEEDSSLLDSILASDEQATNIIEGIRRSVITKMGLRDQPILDRYQDEIFRLPLNSQLLIIGPPGTGKTTTLIRRLGQKVDRTCLDDDERRLGDRTLPEDDLRRIGESLQIQTALRKFTNPIRRYLNGIPGRYRRFRRLRQSEGIWYVATPIPANDVDPQEVDIVLLCTMRTASSLIQDRTVRRNIDLPAYAVLKDFQGVVRNQIMVDEATDFSPITLACMGALSNPAIQSFFACGDFNQRITSWGSRNADEMRWAFPKIDVKPIQVSYRHTRQLNRLASEIVRLCSGETVETVLPKNVENDGWAPVLGVDLTERDETVSWLVEADDVMIVEIIEAACEWGRRRRLLWLRWLRRGYLHAAMTQDLDDGRGDTLGQIRSGKW